MSAYDAFAGDWGRKRRRPWEPFVALLRAATAHRTRMGCVLDCGAGAGRHLAECGRLGRHVVGADLSNALLDLAHTGLTLPPDQRGDLEGLPTVLPRNAHFVACDMRRLPFRPRSFSGVVAVASIHHLIDPTERYRFFEDIGNMLAERGFFCGSVWKRDQDRFRALFGGVPNTPKGDRLAPGEGNVVVPWRSQGAEVAERVYHLFTREELERSLRQPTSLRPAPIAEFGDNFFWLVEKEGVNDT